MKETDVSAASDARAVRKLRTGVRIIGAVCLVIAMAHAILMQAALAFSENVIAVRLKSLDRDATAIDYEAIATNGEYDIHDTFSLIDWVIGEGLSPADLASHATTSLFALIGVVCFVIAWRCGRPARDAPLSPKGDWQ